MTVPLYGATFQGLLSTDQPNLTQIQNSYGKITSGKYVKYSLPLTQVYLTDADFTSTGTAFTNAFTTGKAGANGTSVICCFKGPISNLLPTANATATATYKQFFTDMYNYVTNTGGTYSQAGSVVYWVYQQEVDAAARNGLFTSSQYRTALTNLLSLESAAVVAAGGVMATMRPQMQCTIKFTAFGANQSGGDNTSGTGIANNSAMGYFLPSTGVDVIGWDIYGPDASAPAGSAHGVGYATPPWDTLTNALHSMAGTIANDPLPTWYSGYATTLKYGWAEWGSTGMPTACGSSVPPTSDAGWDVGGLAAWLNTMATYFDAQSPAPIFACLFDSHAAGNGWIVCSGTDLLPSWKFNSLIAGRLPTGGASPTAAFQSIVATSGTGSGGGTSGGGSGFITPVASTTTTTSVSSTGTGSIAWTASPTAIGDVLVLAIGGSGGAAISSITGGGVTTWQPLVQNAPGSSAGRNAEIWWGTVTATGAAAITINVAGTGNTYAMRLQQFHAGTNYVWSADGVGAVANSATAAASGLYPSVTPTGSLKELYVALGNFAGGSPGGSTTGFTYDNGFGSTTRSFVYATGAAHGVAQVAAWTQTSGAYDVVAGLLSATLAPQAFVGACELAAYRVV